MANLSIMIKPASGLCNMKCKYCFYHEVVKHRDEGNYCIMREDTANNLIDKALEFVQNGNISFVFQGGEPLLAGIDYFKHFIQRIKSANCKANITLSLQTNGSLINEEWAEFFAENNFLIGISLDGDIEGNKNRIMNADSPVFDNIINSINLLDRYKVEYNILSVVTAENSERIESIYNYFKSCGFKFLQFIPCIRPFDYKGDNELYMSEKQYENYLITLFKLYARDFLKGNYISIRQLDNFVRLYSGGMAEQCGMSGYCSRQFVIEGNGNVYPCDFYCTDEWLLGNINSTDFHSLLHSKKSVEFVKNSIDIEDKCKKCIHFKYCRGGGCKRDKESFNYCSSYKNFFEKCAPLFDRMALK
ncbi:MAG: radical SAM protein, partial [Clostridia bacterium]|nr:radical SAM protein [Clostridia bacterium]